MSDYKRWISYMYIYESNVKKNNVGYIRVEQRGDRTRIAVHIKVMSITEPMKVYLYVRHEEKMKAIYVGDITLDKNVSQPVYHLETEIPEDIVNMSDTGGVIVYYNDDKFFGSEWDDISISIADFEITDSGMAENEAVSDEEAGSDDSSELIATSLDKEVPAAASEETYSPNEMPESGEMYVPEEYVSEDEEYASESEENVSENEEEASKNEYAVKEECISEECEQETTPEIKEMSGNNIKKNKIEEAAKKMLSSYPKMFPFENDDKIMCVRIEPQDIGQLPIDTWILANNSFLLQGYYSYRHLMLMYTGDDVRPAYLIGVPGIYHGRDEYMAQMFGFGLFKPMRECENLRGEFGYWCISLTDIPESRKYR